jgi:hypothetical protein
MVGKKQSGAERFLKERFVKERGGVKIILCGALKNKLNSIKGLDC